jgi:hypothetical protein
MALGSTQPNRNEYQESSGGLKDGRRVRLTTSLPSVSRLSRENVGASTSYNPMGLHGLLQRELYLFFTWSMPYLKENRHVVLPTAYCIRIGECIK